MGITPWPESEWEKAYVVLYGRVELSEAELSFAWLV